MALLLLIFAALVQAQSSPERLFDEAVAAQQRGDDATAIRKYQQLVKIAPGVVEVRANYGAALARLGRLDEAIAQYKAALAKTDNPGLRFNLALAYYKKGAMGDAAGELERLHAAQPGDARIATLLADCYARLGRDKETLDLLGPMEAANSGDLAFTWMLGSALIRTGHLTPGLERVERVASSGNSAEAHLLAGQTALKMNDFEKARAHAKSALQIAPALPGANTLYGTVLSYLGDNAAAIEALRKAVEADPKDADAHLALGATLHTERDLENARKHLEIALKLNPESNLARYQMAKLERTEGRLDAAVERLQDVVKRDPTWPQPHIELSALYFKLKRTEDGERERALYEKLHAEYPDRL